MKIEEAIQQRHFASEYQKANLNILYTAAWLGQRSSAILKPYSLTAQQFNVLRILRGRHPEPATVKQLTERMLDKMSNASRLVDKLLAKELVARTTCDEDRRRVDIHITAKGLDLLLAASAEMDKVMNETNFHLTLEESIELNRLLDKMRTDEE